MKSSGTASSALITVMGVPQQIAIGLSMKMVSSHPQAARYATNLS